MNKYYMIYINELSLEEMAHLGKPKLNEIYDKALELRENAQEDKLYELQLSDCDFNIVDELQEEVDMFDELLTRLEVVIENDYI